MRQKTDSRAPMRPAISHIALKQSGNLRFRMRSSQAGKPVRTPAIRSLIAVCMFSILGASAIITPVARATVPRSFLKRDLKWFHSEEGQTLVGRVLSHQSTVGSWPKIDTTAEYTADDNRSSGTFDNGATTSEVRFLARAVLATDSESCRQSIERAIAHLLEAQYDIGGWPQRYPPGSSYHRHITFNDNVMVRIMELLRDVADTPDYRFLDASQRTAARHAFDRGIQCILACQVIVNDERTVWCAQHDEISFKPQGARTFELASLSGAESAGILRLLMSVETPDPSVRTAIESGVNWFERAAIEGIKVESYESDRRIVADPGAPRIWARFYDLQTNRPLFAGRNGVPRARLSEIEAERRNGYAWYGNWGESVAAEYHNWRQRQADKPNP